MLVSIGCWTGLPAMTDESSLTKGSIPLLVTMHNVTGNVDTGYALTASVRQRT